MMNFKHIIDKLTPGIGREVALAQVLRALTAKRIWNATINVASFLLSWMIRKPVVWGYPPIVNIEPTNICNLHCPLCVTGCKKMKRPRGYIDMDSFQRFVDRVADRVIYLTLYHQGEPYLHKQFHDMVAYAKQKGVYVTTSTNAHFISREEAERVVKSGLDSMIISLDGVEQSTYETYRIGGHFDTVIDGIQNLVEAKKRFKSRVPYLLLQFLVMKHNQHELSKIKELSRELGVDRLLIKTIEVTTLEEAKAWLPDDKAYRRYHVSEKNFTVKQGKGACPRLWLNTLVDWDGALVPCCFDKNADYKMGNVWDHDFETLWRNDVYTAFRKQMLDDRNSIDMCRNCNYGIGLFK